MDLIDHLQTIAGRIPALQNRLETEEATKNALVMPFIKALGYAPFDPFEVVPEFTADVGTKRGEKVDYAIMKDDAPIILIECKKVGSKLDFEQASQLYRYFSVVDARIAILTDGIIFKFFSDLEQDNRMDERPFLLYDMLKLEEFAVGELKKLTKSHFDIERALKAASDLKYTRQIKSIFAQQLTDPEEEFLRFFISKIHSGRITAKVLEEFTPTIKASLGNFISERISSRLAAALAQEEGAQAAQISEVTEDEEDDGIITTDQELEAFHIVKAIMRRVVDVERVSLKDVKSYCSVLLDGNARQPICRFWFNTSQLYLGVFDVEKNEERIPVSSLDVIYEHSNALQATVGFYEEE